MRPAHRFLPTFPLASALALSALASCTGGAGHDAPYAEPEPSEVAAALARGLEGSVQLQPQQVPVAHRVFSLPGALPTEEVTLDNCTALEGLLQGACALVNEAGLSDYCGASTTYFMAHSTPRCAARVTLFSERDELEPIYAFDLSGVPQDAPPDECGNGIVDEGEQCDDGNLEEWDGCDPTCRVEEFQGCEAVIEQYYQQAGLAFVDRTLWDGPRSQLMVNPTVRALTRIDERNCNAAIAIGADVCNELSATMPFVGSCWPRGELVQDEAGARCNLRFEVGFSQPDPGFGVFTTGMTGILAFSIPADQ